MMLFFVGLEDMKMLRCPMHSTFSDIFFCIKDEVMEVLSRMVVSDFLDYTRSDFMSVCLRRKKNTFGYLSFILLIITNLCILCYFCLGVRRRNCLEVFSSFRSLPTIVLDESLARWCTDSLCFSAKL